ncbi:4-amino-4-deoxy-L-arabinose transferase-like glycosyltransferase [Anaerospora hongkongensis]|uniref:4-amino-4-deoxy-L-arabinose transferase-like glycosyltransferase n=1 Tax=Anaerospora hongkongensis TaxID=244830 RepID=A0A4R1PZW7_9FIRM|nr:glycosyltransferase family 39 protein [Anaerospora hongkongensis]TCL38716.1 4-amino-4-deoxy-L-arabinose transferase-like glycosyltransferase [Anaerospora hongkongensis]
MTIRTSWIYAAIIIAVAGILMFSYLGSQPLLDPDEPVYAETAKEMLQYHDFISPRIFGDFWYDKPPMYYWLVAAAFQVFGGGEFAARFPSALFAVGGALLVFFSGRKLFNERAGFLAALILATSLEYFYLGNAAVTDMTLTFFLTAALLAFLHRQYNLLYVFAALGVVTKGPVAIFFCTVILGVYLAMTGQLKTVKHMQAGRGVLLFAAIALPWYVIMYVYHGMDFINTFLGFHNVTRFLQPEHSSGKLWYYYIPVVVLGFFPWTAFLAQAFSAAIKETGEKRNTCLFLIIWAVAVFSFFSLSQTKLVSYILPMYPPLAMLVGYYFDKAWTERQYRALKTSAAVFSAAAILMSAGLLYAATAVTAELIVPVKVIAGMLAVLAVSVLYQSFHGKFRAVFSLFVAGMVVFTALIMTQALPAVIPAVSVKPVVDEFKQQYDGQAPVYVAKFYRPGFQYYSDVTSFELNPEELEAAVLSQPDKAYFIVQKRKYDKLSPEVRSTLRVVNAQEDKILFIRGSE